MEKNLITQFSENEIRDKELMAKDLEQLKIKDTLAKENNIKQAKEVKSEQIDYSSYATNNPVASFIKLIAIVEVFVGVYLLASGMGIMGIVTGVVSAVLTWGFAEIIQILHDIRKNTRR